MDVIKKKVALPVPAHVAGMDHQLEDIQVAVIRTGLLQQDKRRREEMCFIHNFGTVVPGGLNQDFSFTLLARAHTRLFLRAHFHIFKFSAITNSHIFPNEGSIAETSELYLQLSAFNLPPSHFYSLCGFFNTVKFYFVSLSLSSSESIRFFHFFKF